SDVAIRAAISVDEDYVAAPLLGEVELTRTVRAWIQGRIDKATFFGRLVVLENLLQYLEAAALIHEGNAAVVWRYIIGWVTGIDASPGGKVERRAAGRATDTSASRSATVNVLFVAQFVVVVCGVITLPCEKWLQAVLATNVYRKKLFAIFAREVIE